MKSRTRIVPAAAAVTAVLALSACGSNGGAAEGDGIVINVGHVVADTEPVHIELLATAERIEEATDGRVRFEVFANAELGSNQDLIEQAATGQATAAHLDPGYVVDWVPEMGILSGPFLFESPEDIRDLTSSDLFAEWQDQLAEDAGLISLSWDWYWGDRHIIADRAVATPDDLAGLSIRVPPNQVWIRTFDTLGASPTQLEWAEVYSGLQQGVIDSAEAPLSVIRSSSLDEVKGVITETSHFAQTTGFVIGTDTWDQISEADQEIVLAEFADGAVNLAEATIENEANIRAELEADGIEFATADIDAYRASIEPFYADYPDWPESLYSDVVDLIGQ